MFLLDTNIISELRRADRAPPSLARWAMETPVAQTFLSVITLFGQLKVKNRKQ